MGEWHVCLVEQCLGDEHCNHEWKPCDFVVDTATPIYHRVCVKCGRLESRRDD